MPRPDKVAMVAEVRERLEGSAATVLTEYRGLTVADLARLRGDLRRASAEYRIVKNTLTAIALRDAGYDVPDDLLTGPTAVTFCAGDPVAAAKVLRAFSRTNPSLVVKGGLLEGRLLDAAETLSLADLASREELLARAAGLFQAMTAMPARLALANLTKAAQLVQALIDKRTVAGDIPEPSPQPPESTAGADSAPPADAFPQPSETASDAESSSSSPDPGTVQSEAPSAG